MRPLIDRLNRAADAYYNGLGELMTDFEWDALFDQLRALEAQTGHVEPDSPTHRVSADTTAGQKEAHEFPALSLAKTKQPADIAKWAGGRPVWLSWKLDGLTLVATYDGGRLTRVVTRGDGHTGTNITHLAPAIGGLPQRINADGHTVVRGEAVISYADFEEFLTESGGDYANPRNLASGSLSLKDVAEVARRRIQWVPFTLVHTARADLTAWGQRMAWLDALGLRAVERELVSEPTEENIRQVIAAWTRKVEDGKVPYPVDGLVVAYDDTVYAAGGSVTGHHATRAGLAFKWQDEQAETVLDHIEWSCAAQSIAPVAVFQPVQLEGTTVARASLCNISECERLGIGGWGTRLAVIKANKIIPKVVSVQQTAGALEIPATCPACGAPTEIVTSDSGTRTLHCTNAQCPAKELRKFARFVSKDGMDIDGLSEQSLARFVSHGWVRGVADIYRLATHVREMALLVGFGAKSAAKLTAAIDAARTRPATAVLYALAIPLCGKDVCKRLVGAYPWQELIGKARAAADPACFEHIDGIGPEKSTAFVAWMQDAANAAALDDLLTQITVSQPALAPTGDACAGLTFVITGDVHHFKNRAALKTYIESQGGKATGSVSKATSFLINNDLASTSGKNKKARELGIPVISEDEFVERWGAE